MNKLERSFKEAMIEPQLTANAINHTFLWAQSQSWAYHDIKLLLVLIYNFSSSSLVRSKDLGCIKIMWNKCRLCSYWSGLLARAAWPSPAYFQLYNYIFKVCLHAFLFIKINLILPVFKCCFWEFIFNIPQFKYFDKTTVKVI